MIDVCILGAGITGLSLAYTLLEKGCRVTVIGPDVGAYYSAHNDHSRLFRVAHNSHYWRSHCERNLEIVNKLFTPEERQKFFRFTDVYYNRGCKYGTDSVSNKNGISAAGLNFVSRDKVGAIIDPLQFITSLKEKCVRKWGGSFRHLCCRSGAPVQFGDKARIPLEQGSNLTANFVIDARGAFSEYAFDLDELQIVGKQLFHFSKEEVEFKREYCFLYFLENDDVFSDIYGFVNIDPSFSGKHKIGMTENKPFIIRNKVELIDWFDKLYMSQGVKYLAEEKLRAYFGESIRIDVSPCVLVKNKVDKANIYNISKNIVYVNACNGGLVKSCLSVAEELCANLV